MGGALLVGLSAGAGLFLIVAALIPSPPPLASALAELRRRPQSRASGTERGDGVGLIGALVRALAASPLGRRLGEDRRTDLRITGTTLADHLARRLAAAVMGVALAPVLAGILALAGVRVGLLPPLWVSVVAGPIGWLWPSWSLRSQAAARRRSLRHALCAFLDVVSIGLAGGRGVEAALHDGASAGQGWAFDELRAVMAGARLRGETPWAALARAGDELGVAELGELAASAGLAGDEGARVRSSLAAKAQALRQRGLSEIEAAAHSASELMSLPVVILMFGFVLFLGYPAIARVLQGI